MALVQSGCSSGAAGRRALTPRRPARRERVGPFRGARVVFEPSEPGASSCLIDLHVVHRGKAGAVGLAPEPNLTMWYVIETTLVDNIYNDNYIGSDNFNPR